MACWDVLGKAAGKPVYELLGGACRPLAIRSRFSMGAYDVPRARAGAAELVAQGFDTVKVKVGGKPEDDIARVRAVREVIGPERKLVIDANCGWDADTAIRCVRELTDCRIDLVEQPTPDGDYAAIARVRRECGVPVMADDMCFNLVHAQELIRNQACDLISVYPGKNGGIRKSREIVRVRRAARRRLHDRLEPGIRHRHRRDGPPDRRHAEPASRRVARRHPRPRLLRNPHRQKAALDQRPDHDDHRPARPGRRSRLAACALAAPVGKLEAAPLPQSQQPLLEIGRQGHAEAQRLAGDWVHQGQLGGVQRLARCAAGVGLRRLAGACV